MRLLFLLLLLIVFCATALLPQALTSGLAGAGSGSASPPETPSDEFKVRVVAELSATSVYVGEQVVLTYRVLARDFISNIEIREQPQYVGFWVKELRESAKVRRPALPREGLYEVAAKRLLLYPTLSGRLQIAPMKLAIRLYPPVNQSLLGATPRTIMRASPPLALDVRPLPPPPDGLPFSGAVGQFALTANLRPARIRLGETATMEVKVTGQGNTDALVAPAMPESADLKFFVKRIDIKPQTETLPDESGEAVWQVRIAARRAAVYELPVIFAYFDPRAGQYRTARAAPLRLQVDEAHEARGGSSREGINKAREGELHFDSSTKESAASLAKWIGYGLGGLGVLIAAFLVSHWRKRLKPQMMVTEVVEREESPARRGPNLTDEQQVEDCLTMAEWAARLGDRQRLLAALVQALAYLFGIRFGLTPAELAPTFITARLHERGLPVEVAYEAAMSFSRLEALRFNPQAENVIDRQLLDQVRRLIIRLREF